MKKSKLFIISSVALLFAIAGLTVYAFYNFFYRNNGSTLSLVEVVFSVNDSNVKNKNDVVYFSTDDMSQGDGYEIVLNYSINGSFSSTNAVRYSTYFQSLTGGIDGERNIANGVEVYRFNGENYEYLDNLGNLISQTTPVMTDYLGSTGTNREKFMLVYGEATVVENRVPFGLQISTTSEVVATDAENFPYYYLANLGKNSAESILEQLPKNSAVYGRTIVLTKDINYQGGDITFDHVVGIDLNGHTLNLNGAKLTIKDTADGSEPFLTDLAIIDSKDSGSVTNGTITLNLSKTVMDVDTELLSYVTVSNINMSIFEQRLQNSLNDIASQKRLMNTESNDTFSYHFDALRGLKFYVKKGTVSVAISGSDESVSYNSSDCTFDVTGLETSNIVYVAITATKSGSEPAIANANLSLYGKSLQDAAEYLMNYVPKVIEGSIYLPQYLPKFNAYVTWISFDDDLINSNGTVLQNGYINLDSWVSKNTKLGFVLDQSGEIKNGIINDITIQILSEEERAELLHDHSITMFDYETVTTYSFDTIDVLLHKRDIDASQANEALFNNIKNIATNEFGINLTTTFDSSAAATSINALKAEFKTKIFEKLGIDEITVDAVNEASLYVTNDKDLNDNITSVRQISIPKATVDLVYHVNYKFLSGNTVTENKTIDVSNGEATTTATDIANTIRVPFDTYTRTMINPISTDPYCYESFIDSFELVSNFSGAEITYRVDDEFKDYVEIKTVDGKKYVHIITSKSPAETKDVKVYYTIGDVENYVTFKLVGILHNGIEIKDANLYVELLAQYDVNKDNILTILEAEHAEGTSFTCSSKGIVSLQGLRYFTNITSLTMNDNKLIDIDDLAYLTGLTNIEMRNNYIADVSSLKYLDSLTTINLRNNQITDISPLQYLTKIENLYLEFNKISNFQYVQNLVTLKNLRVFNNTDTSGQGTVGTDSGGTDQIRVIRKSNQYYFALLKGKRGKNINIYIATIDESKRTKTENSSAFSFTSNTTQEALILNKIVPISEVNNVIALPTYISDNTNYEITYIAEATDQLYVSITRQADGTIQHVTNVVINQIPVDNEVSVYAYTTGLDGLAIYRKITFVILEGGNAGQIQLKDDTGNYFYAYANVVIPDLKLRAALFRGFDTDSDGIISYSELTASKELNLEFVGVKSLDGLQYFTGITSLNLRGNVLTEANDLWYVSYLQNLTTLKVNGQEFDYDNLVYFSTKDKATYDKSNDYTFVVKDIYAVDHNVDGIYGLTSLETLNVNGSYNLDSDEVKTELYHVYLNNNVKIYIKDDSTIWNPIAEEVSKLIGSMTTSATFINIYDQIQIAENYNFYLYDDLLSTSFSLTYNAPQDTYYNHDYRANEDGVLPDLYYFSGASTLKYNGSTPSRFNNKGNYKTSRLFINTSSDGVITVKYIKLSAFDLTTYSKMVLSSTDILWNNKDIDIASINYYLSLNVQFNDSYKLYNDVDETDSINNGGQGTSLNKVFGSIESMIYVMDGVTSQIFGKSNGIIKTDTEKGFDNNAFLRGFYYSVTDVNGNVSYYYNEGDSTLDIYTDKTDAISRVEEYETKKSVYYDGTTQAGKTYKNGFFLYVSQLKKDFKYNNKNQAVYFISTSVELLLCVKLEFAETVTDGLQYLEMVESIGASNGMSYGDGHTLINLKIIRDVFGYVNISTITTPLPKLEVWNLNRYFMTELADENGTSDSDPSKLIASYLVYFPNLKSFVSRVNFLDGENGTAITDWSAFLVYSYIPFGQTIDTRFNRTNSIDKNDALIGGMQLQDNKLYYYDSSYGMKGCFRVIYDASGSELDVTDYDSSSITQTVNSYYVNLFMDNDGNALPSTASLFRKSQQNQLSYVVVGSDLVNSGTTNQKIVLTQDYLNRDTSKVVASYYYLTAGSMTTDTTNHGQAQTVIEIKNSATIASQSDWSPEMEEVKYVSTSQLEWSEFSRYIAHLDVKLTGQMCDGTVLSNTLYDSINWNSLEYTDLFKTGLTVTLPSKLSEFLTSYSDFDDYRDFDVNWQLISLNGNTTQSTDINANSYTFSSVGYYILCCKINNNSNCGLMFEFSITNKTTNFTEWYEKIKDKTLKYLVFINGGSSVSTINYTYSSDISLSTSGISNDVAKKFFPSIYLLDGIDSLTNLTNLELDGFYISYIPSLPTSIVSLTLKNNLIGDIGDILDGSKYTTLESVDLTNNYLDLKESNFKDTNYYTTKIKSLKLYCENKTFFIDTTQLSYFNKLTYDKSIKIYFRNELYYSYGGYGVNAISWYSLLELETLIGKANVTVYASQHTWDDSVINSTIVSNIKNAYESIGDPDEIVSFDGNNVVESKTYTKNLQGGISSDKLSVSMVWNGSNWGTINYYQKMVTPYYLVVINYDDYKIVKELHGTFYNDLSANATLNGIPISTLQANLDHRVIEQLYKNATFEDGGNEFAGTVNLNQGVLNLSNFRSEILDLKGLDSIPNLNLTTITSDYDTNIREVKNYSGNNITSITIASPNSIVRSINDATGNVSYSFNTPVSRNIVNRNSSSTLTGTFNYNTISVYDNYNYALTSTFTISDFKTKIYNEIINSTNNTGEFYDRFSLVSGSIANLTSLHINKGIRFFGGSLYSNSSYYHDDANADSNKDADILENVIAYGINIDSNNKRLLTNGAVISPALEDLGRRYVLLNTGDNSTISKIKFPTSFVLNGEIISMSYSSLVKNNNKYVLVIDDNTTYWEIYPNINVDTSVGSVLITVNYSSVSYNGSISFYVDVIAGKNPEETEFADTITNWYVEMQDGTLVHAGEIFESPVLAANIFNGIGKVLFSTQLIMDGDPQNKPNDSSPNYINGNLLMEEVNVDGSLCKVLRQSVISQIKTITNQARSFMYLGGLEIFYNLKAICFINTVGYDFGFATNMQLERFKFTHKRNTITPLDFSFLNNSRDTLKKFEYLAVSGDNTPLQDMSWLVSFNSLTSVMLSGPDGVQYTPTFQYFLTAMYLKYHKDIVKYNSSTYSSLNISDYIKSAATIMYNLSSFDTSSDSSFIYQNGFELFSKDGKIEENKDYYLPSYLYSAGDYFKIQWNSLSSFVDISVVYNDSIITIVEYENQYKEWKKSNPNESDYEFCKDYTVKIKFKDLASTTSYKAFVSMKIEYESKFSDVYTPVMSTITDMATNYAKYYKASYTALTDGVEFVKNKYYYKDSSDNYKLLLVKPDDWDGNTSNYFDMVYTACTSSETYSSSNTYYTRYIFEPHMFERILTINLAKNNQYKQLLLNKYVFNKADYLVNNSSIYDGISISGDYTSVVSSNSSVIEVVEHNVNVAETRYFIKDGDNYINVNASNYNELLATKDSSTEVYYYYVGRLCAGTTYSSGRFYSYDSTNHTYTCLTASNAPDGWTNTRTNYYTFTKFTDSAYQTTLGAIADKLNVNTKVYGIYLKDPNYTGLVTITCTCDGTTEEYYVYWER